MTWKNDLDQALDAAFKLDPFMRLLDLRLKRNINDYAGITPYPVLRARVLSDAENGGWLRDLVREALWMNPANSALRQFRAAHPELSPASIRENEAADLRIGIESAYPRYEDLGAFIAAEFDAVIDEIVGRGAGAIPSDYVLLVIRWCDARGVVDRLIQHSLDQRDDPFLRAKASPVLTALRAREATAGYRRPDPFDTCMINDSVFMNRKALRRALRAWSPNPRKPILAVNGPAQSGKTHSFELIRYVAMCEACFQVAGIDLTQEQHARFRPGALVRSIMFQLGRSDRVPLMPKEEESGSTARWTRELVDWLVGEARQSVEQTSKIWVVGLDGFYHPDLPAETRDMVKELVKRAAMAGAPLRVVLLHYDDELMPVDVQNRVAREDIGAITREDLHDFLVKLSEQQGIAVEDGVIDEVVTDVLNHAPNADLPAVARGVQAWIDGFAEEAEEEQDP